MKTPVALAVSATLTLVACELSSGDNTNPDGAPVAASVSLSRILGGPAVGEDTLTGAAVGDGSGVLFLSGNVNGWGDRFSEDISIARIEADGTLGWHRVWAEDFEQLQPDPGQNAEAGGSARSMALDATGLYAVGRRSQSSSNNVFQTLVFKVAPDTGEMLWARGWTPGIEAIPSVVSQSSQGYAVALAGDTVLVTGELGGEVLLLGLDAGDGSVRFQTAIEVNVGLNDRGHTLVASGADTAWIGGIGDGRAQLLRVTGIASQQPTVDWAARLELGLGSNVNDLTVDSVGNLYLSLDRRGATTYFSAARLTADGALSWMKTFDPENILDRNNTHTVHLMDDDTLFVGGRIGFLDYDEIMGDGFLMQLDATSGSLVWAAHYYTELGGDARVEHRVKGLSAHPTAGLAVGLQSYTSETNTTTYDGTWLTPPTGSLIDDTLTLTDILADVSTRTLDDGTAHTLDTSAIWTSPPTSITYEPLETRTGNGSDGDAVILHMRPTP